MELFVSTEELKAHLNITAEYVGEDEYLLGLLETAQVSAEMSIHRPLSDCVKEGRLNPMLKHAIKILAGTFYANREAVAYMQPHPVPYTIDYLFQPFRKYT